MEVPVNSAQGSSNISELKKNNLDDIHKQRPDSEPIIYDESTSFAKGENVKLKNEKWWNFNGENLIWNAKNLSVQKIGNFEPPIQCLTTVEENLVELTNQVVF